LKNSDKIGQLTEIWANIPKSETEQVILPQEEIVKKFLNLFHPGDFFYIFFNTRTAVMEYVTPDIEAVLGYTGNEFNLSLFLDSMHPEDRPFYIYHEKRATEFFGSLPEDKLTKYKFSHDFRIMHKNGNYKRLLIQVIPVYFFTDGGARTLCVFTDISYLKMHGKPQLSFIGLEGEPSFYNVELGNEFRPISHSFTRREIEILKYTAEGKRSVEISELLNISRLTVDTHRKNILAKSQCNNVNELIAKSIREGWI
jgi:DNA-binding CsgD family transcriptional regulator